MTTTASPPVASGTGLPDVSQITSSDSALRRFLHGLPGVDQVGAEARAAMLSTRSIKTSAKAWAIDLAISMIDLTTLEGSDTPGKVRGLAAKALLPDPTDGSTPRPAAVCVYGDMVPAAKAALGASSGVKVAAVATAFPSGRASLPVKLADTRDAVEAGAEIRSFSHLEGCRVGAGAVIGPYARLRPGTDVGARAHVGNFVELKATQLGAGAKANHIAYLGDASIGAGSNVGAGAITCN